MEGVQPLAGGAAASSARASASFQLEQEPGTRRRSARQSIVDTLDAGLNLKGTVKDDEALELPNSVDATRNPRQSIQASFQEAKRSTLLDQEALKQLEEGNPGITAWLQSTKGFIMQVLLFTLFISIDSGKSLFGSLALKGTTTVSQSLVLSSNLSSIAIGLAISYKQRGMDGVKQCMDPELVQKFALPACIFALSTCFGSLSLAFLSPGTVKIFGQLRLLQTAILSTLFLKRRYFPPQWTSIIAVVLSAMCFFMGMSMDKHYRGAKIATMGECETLVTTIVENDEGKTPAQRCKKLVYGAGEASGNSAGLLCVLLFIFFSDVGSIVSEKFLKGGGDTPFYVQKVAIDLVGMPCSLAMAVINPYFLKLVGLHPDVYEKQMFWKAGFFGFFQGWGWAVCVAICFSTLQSWLSGLIVKQLSSLMKLLGKVFSLVVVYFLADCWLTKVGNGPPVVCTMAQFAVVLSTLSFLMFKPPKED